jgi:hypothetical protein
LAGKEAVLKGSSHQAFDFDLALMAGLAESESIFGAQLSAAEMARAKAMQEVHYKTVADRSAEMEAPKESPLPQQASVKVPLKSSLVALKGAASKTSPVHIRASTSVVLRGPLLKQDIQPRPSLQNHRHVDVCMLHAMLLRSIMGRTSFHRECCG